MDVTPTVVEITIDHLSIEGFGSVDRAVIRRSLQRDLAHIIQEHGIPGVWTSGQAPAEVRTSLEWDGRGGAHGLSAALAAQLYEGMKR